MTGLYEFLRKWIIKKAFYFNISDTPGLDASTAYLLAAILGNAGNTFVLKNILTFREVSGSLHTFVFTDTSFLSKCINMYDGSSSKNGFRIFFKDKLSKVSGCPDTKFI